MPLDRMFIAAQNLRQVVVFLRGQGATEAGLVEIVREVCRGNYADKQTT